MALFSKRKKIPIKESDERNSVLKSLQETPVNDTIQSRKKNVIIRSHIISAVMRIIAFIGACVLVFTCVFGITTTESNDMYPSVRAGDLVLYFRLAQFKRMDVVMYDTGKGKVNIGRVIGMTGDVINKTNVGQITINGDIQPIQKKQGLFYKTYERDGGIKYPVTVDENEYFILGDERDSAKDSRIYGIRRKKDIKGKVFTIIRRRAV